MAINLQNQISKMLTKHMFMWRRLNFVLQWQNSNVLLAKGVVELPPIKSLNQA